MEKTHSIEAFNNMLDSIKYDSYTIEYGISDGIEFKIYFYKNEKSIFYFTLSYYGRWHLKMR